MVLVAIFCSAFTWSIIQPGNNPFLFEVFHSVLPGNLELLVATSVQILRPTNAGSWLPQVPVTSSCPLASHTRAVCTFIQVMGVSSRPPPATPLFPSYLFLLEYLSVSEQSRGPAATTTAVPMGLCLCTFTCRLCTL